MGKLLDRTPESVAVLVTAGKLRPLGRPNPNAVKCFNAGEQIVLLADYEWLDDSTETIGQLWKFKNAGVTPEIPKIIHKSFTEHFRERSKF
jgi:hypothetical protein